MNARLLVELFKDQFGECYSGPGTIIYDWRVAYELHGIKELIKLIDTSIDLLDRKERQDVSIKMKQFKQQILINVEPDANL
jgi:hypothetical protein